MPSYAPQFSVQDRAPDTALKLLGHRSAACEVKTPELIAQLLMDQVEVALKDALREADVFGDPTPTNRALDQAKAVIEKLITIEPKLGSKTPNIGIDLDGRIEIGFSAPAPSTMIFAWIDQSGRTLKLVEVCDRQSHSVGLPL